MKPFVHHNSIVREIWGTSDTVLLIFAGASAEFALNKAVDWLYFTGKLPADPLGRLLSTVEYAKKIVFAPEDSAVQAIESLRHIHAAVENKRGDAIPDWAYRDVLFMLIHYSIASFELLQRPMTCEEKQEVLDVFNRMGSGMGLTGLPPTFSGWMQARQSHMNNDLQRSPYTKDLFQQYRKNLGWLRYIVLVETQKLLVPKRVRKLLQFRPFSIMTLFVPVYKICRQLKLDVVIKHIFLPSGYRQDFKNLDVKMTH